MVAMLADLSAATVAVMDTFFERMKFASASAVTKRVAFNLAQAAFVDSGVTVFKMMVTAAVVLVGTTVVGGAVENLVGARVGAVGGPEAVGRLVGNLVGTLVFLLGEEVVFVGALVAVTRVVSVVVTCDIETVGVVLRETSTRLGTTEVRVEVIFVLVIVELAVMLLPVVVTTVTTTVLLPLVAVTLFGSATLVVVAIPAESVLVVVSTFVSVLPPTVVITTFVALLDLSAGLLIVERCYTYARSSICCCDACCTLRHSGCDLSFKVSYRGVVSGDEVARSRHFNSGSAGFVGSVPSAFVALSVVRVTVILGNDWLLPLAEVIVVATTEVAPPSVVVATVVLKMTAVPAAFAAGRVVVITVQAGYY
jgi:hypothetical protein